MSSKYKTNAYYWNSTWLTEMINVPINSPIKSGFVFAITSMVYYGLAYNAAALPGTGE